MKNKTAKTIIKRLGIFTLLFAITLAVNTTAFGFTLNVVDHNGTPIANGFSWLLEEDNTNLNVVPPVRHYHKPDQEHQPGYPQELRAGGSQR